MKCKKVYFADEKTALFYIDKLKKTSIKEKKPVNTYLCPHCLNWHLTSIEPKEVKNITYLNRQINNLKAKIEGLKQQNEILEQRLRVEQKINLFN
jgi:TolA-binding protein